MLCCALLCCALAVATAAFPEEACNRARAENHAVVLLIDEEYGWRRDAHAIAYVIAWDGPTDEDLDTPRPVYHFLSDTIGSPITLSGPLMFTGNASLLSDIDYCFHLAGASADSRWMFLSEGMQASNLESDLNAAKAVHGNKYPTSPYGNAMNDAELRTVSAEERMVHTWLSAVHAGGDISADPTGMVTLTGDFLGLVSPEARTGAVNIGSVTSEGTSYSLETNGWQGLGTDTSFLRSVEIHCSDNLSSGTECLHPCVEYNMTYRRALDAEYTLSATAFNASECDSLAAQVVGQTVEPESIAAHGSTYIALNQAILSSGDSCNCATYGDTCGRYADTFGPPPVLDAMCACCTFQWRRALLHTVFPSFDAVEVVEDTSAQSASPGMGAFLAFDVNTGPGFDVGNGTRWFATTYAAVAAVYADRVDVALYSMPYDDLAVFNLVSEHTAEGTDVGAAVRGIESGIPLNMRSSTPLFVHGLSGSIMPSQDIVTDLHFVDSFLLPTGTANVKALEWATAHYESGSLSTLNPSSPLIDLDGNGCGLNIAFVPAEGQRLLAHHVAVRPSGGITQHLYARPPMATGTSILEGSVIDFSACIPAGATITGGFVRTADVDFNFNNCLSAVESFNANSSNCQRICDREECLATMHDTHQYYEPALDLGSATIGPDASAVLARLGFEQTSMAFDDLFEAIEDAIEASYTDPESEWDDAFQAVLFLRAMESRYAGVDGATLTLWPAQSGTVETTWLQGAIALDVQRYRVHSPHVHTPIPEVLDMNPVYASNAPNTLQWMVMFDTPVDGVTLEHFQLEHNQSQYADGFAGATLERGAGASWSFSLVVPVDDFVHGNSWLLHFTSGCGNAACTAYVHSSLSGEAWLEGHEMSVYTVDTEALGLENLCVSNVGVEYNFLVLEGESVQVELAFNEDVFLQGATVCGLPYVDSMLVSSDEDTQRYTLRLPSGQGGLVAGAIPLAVSGYQDASGNVGVTDSFEQTCTPDGHPPEVREWTPGAPQDDGSVYQDIVNTLGGDTRTKLGCIEAWREDILWEQGEGGGATEGSLEAMCALVFTDRGECRRYTACGDLDTNVNATWTIDLADIFLTPSPIPSPSSRPENNHPAIIASGSITLTFALALTNVQQGHIRSDVQFRDVVRALLLLPNWIPNTASEMELLVVEVTDTTVRMDVSFRSYNDAASQQSLAGLDTVRQSPEVFVDRLNSELNDHAHSRAWDLPAISGSSVDVDYTPPEVVATEADDDSDDGGTSSAEKAGIAILSIMGIALLGFAIWFALFKKKADNPYEQNKSMSRIDADDHL